MYKRTTSTAMAWHHCGAVFINLHFILVGKILSKFPSEISPKSFQPLRTGNGSTDPRSSQSGNGNAVEKKMPFQSKSNSTDFDLTRPVPGILTTSHAQGCMGRPGGRSDPPPRRLDPLKENSFGAEGKF
eukprot:EG_transcript_18199